jgi:hypothetical protein
MKCKTFPGLHIVNSFCICILLILGFVAALGSPSSSIGGMNDSPQQNASMDRDDDGLLNDDEAIVDTDPDNPDSDGDSIRDGGDPDVLAVIVKRLPDDAFKSQGKGHRTAILSRLTNAERYIIQGGIDKAIDTLKNLREHMDGCPSKPDKTDWIIDCESQEMARRFLDILLSNHSSCEALERWAASVTENVALTEDDEAFLQLAVEAYIWGYAPMTIYRLEQEKINSQAPQNHFYHPTHVAFWQLPSPVSAPNMDVLYSSAFLDLSQGPLIFTMPRVEGYYVVQLDDAYGNSQASLGSRTRPGGAADSYLIVGPSDPAYADPSSYLSQGFDQQHVLPVDTEHAWLIVRIPVNPYAEPGSPYTLTDSASYQANVAFDLTPLLKPQPVRPMDPAVAEIFQEPPSDAMTFFTWLGMAVKASPLPVVAAFSNPVLPPYLMSPSASVSEAQQALFDSFRTLGLDAKGFHPERLNCRQRALLEAGMVIADSILQAGQNFITVGPPDQNYWHVMGTSNIGKYPNTPSGWFMRSVAAYEGGIASLAPDGTYPTTSHDAHGARVRGGSAYTITFDADNLPPVSGGGFWSLTIYSDDSASGVETNLPAVSSAAVLNTAYSQLPEDATSVVNTMQFYNPDYQEDDTVYFAVSGGGIEAESPYFVINVSGGVFQLSRGPWTPDHSGMEAITVDPSIVGKTLMTGLVIPVHSLGSQQLPDAPPGLRGTQLAFEEDGSGNRFLRLYLQNTPPALRSNWLPIPDSRHTFQVMARLYNPTPATEQSGGASILSSTTIPLTTDDPELANQYPQEPVNDSNRYGTFVLPPIVPIE